MSSRYSADRYYDVHAIMLHTNELILLYLVTAQDLWKTITSVSNAGAKRGRAKRRGATKFKDLNLGQRFGYGN